jgi:hypothetical protein
MQFVSFSESKTVPYQVTMCAPTTNMRIPGLQRKDQQDSTCEMVQDHRWTHFYYVIIYLGPSIRYPNDLHSVQNATVWLVPILISLLYIHIMDGDRLIGMCLARSIQ